jgi:alpha-beta hydrolase superfamily lysophospholipase
MVQLRTIIAAVLAVFVTQAWGAEEAVQLRMESGTLHGTLALPSDAPPFPVVIIIAGSGATDRDGNQPQLKNDSLKLLAQALAAEGIASLRYDKRGVGESAAAGAKEEQLRFELYVGDAVRWVGTLREDSRFSRVGLIGHSEGSLIGMIAAKQTKIDAFVSIAGLGRAAPAVLRSQLSAQLPKNLRAKFEKILDELTAGRVVADAPGDLAFLFRPSLQPYLISWFKYDPTREIAALDVPVLIVQGTTDLQVGVDDAQRLAAAKPGAKLALIDNMNHVLKRAVTPAEQQTAYTDPSLPIVKGAVEEITRFVRSVIR